MSSYQCHTRDCSTCCSTRLFTNCEELSSIRGCGQQPSIIGCCALPHGLHLLHLDSLCFSYFSWPFAAAFAARLCYVPFENLELNLRCQCRWPLKGPARNSWIRNQTEKWAKWDEKSHFVVTKKAAGMILIENNFTKSAVHKNNKHYMTICEHMNSFCTMFCIIQYIIILWWHVMNIFKIL